jgi:hypothetical protein
MQPATCIGADAPLGDVLEHMTAEGNATSRAVA